MKNKMQYEVWDNVWAKVYDIVWKVVVNNVKELDWWK